VAALHKSVDLVLDHVLEVSMEYRADAKCVDVSLYFAALSLLFELEYLCRNVDDSTCDMARYISCCRNAFFLSLAFKEA
jgi:hypothetical protein